MRPELKERVEAAVSELRFVPNAHARALAQIRNATIGVIIHDISDPYFGEIASGILKQADQQNLMVTICNTYRDPERELAYIRLLRSQQVQAIILTGSGRTDTDSEGRLQQELQDFMKAGGKVVCIGRRFVGHTILPENSAGGAQVADHLFGLGHRDITVINGPPHLTTSQDRLEGFLQRLRTLGRHLPRSHIVNADFTRDGGYRAAHHLLARVPHLSAVFALNDLMAIGALAALREAQRSVPEQVSLVGFDDIAIVRELQPALTTVRLPMTQAGQAAVQLLNNELGLASLSLPTQLVERQSVGPAPSRQDRS